MSSDFYAGKTGGAPAAPQRAPSGGGGGGVSHMPAGGAVGGGGGGVAVSRPQKTQVLTHAEQSAIGGPGAPTPHIGGGPQPHPGLPNAGLPPETHGGIGEHQGPHPDPGGIGARAPSQRDERAHPDQFRDWDRRFDQDRDRLGNTYWRTAFSDYDRDRFIHYIGDDRLLYHIFGINYYPEYINYAVPYYPTACGTWVIGADGRWYLVQPNQLSIITRIESLRGIRAYRPVVVPCGYGFPY